MWIAPIEALAGIDEKKDFDRMYQGGSGGASASSWAKSLEELVPASKSLNARNLPMSHF
jgi:hypothetical protein